MLASVGELPADDAAWAYEMKWDGLRAIATVSAGALTLTSRTGRDMTSGYPELAGLAEAVGQHEVVLDGEIVALRGDGWPSFEALQQRMNVTSAGQVRRLAAEIPVSYLAFDLLFADGRALADLPSSASRAPTCGRSPGGTASKALWRNGSRPVMRRGSVLPPGGRSRTCTARSSWSAAGNRARVTGPS